MTDAGEAVDPTRLIRATRPATAADLARRLDPTVSAWFAGKHGAFTPAQLAVATEILDGENVLLSASTGSGKTLAAMVPLMSTLIGEARDGRLDARIHALYITPLRALNNDVAKNLLEPLTSIAELLTAEGTDTKALRIGVRTGDTPPAERERQARKPPHVLVTTPESLAILLTSPRMAANLCRVRAVIVDEVHAFLESKRGSHLALALERLSHLVTRTGGPDFQRIGLSATVHPLREAAAFVFGDRRGAAAHVAGSKPLDVDIVLPVPDLMRTTSSKVRQGTLARVQGYLDANASTLVFANTRHGTEGLVAALEGFRGEHGAPTDDGVGAHHGSMSRETRHDVEDRLKRGVLRGVVTSASLELGIDVGSLDLVVQLASPKRVTRLLQRAGRAGHRPSDAAKARVIAMDRDDLVECVVLASLAREGRLERVEPPRAPLDVLAQHILGVALEEPIATLREAFRVTRRAHPYRDLSWESFIAVTRYLAGLRRDGSEGWNARLRLDEETGEFSPRGRLVRATYMLNQGTIPSEGRVRVFEGDTFIGEIEEDFASMLDPGQIFVLAGTTWRVIDSGAGRVAVAQASGTQPTVPRWRGERMSLTPDGARGIRELRERIRAEWALGTTPEITEALICKHYNVSRDISSTIVRYHLEQAGFDALGAPGELVAEEFVDDEGFRVYAFHAIVGRRANDVLARLLARRVSDARGGAVTTLVSDAAFAIRVPRGWRLRARDFKHFFLTDVDAEIRASAHGTELHVRRFRHVAERALLFLRRDPRDMQGAAFPRRAPDAERVLAALVATEGDHIVLEETERELLHDALDIDTAKEMLVDLATGKLRLRLLQGRVCPSPFAHHLLAQGLEDAVGTDDRGALLRDLHDRAMLTLSKTRAEPPGGTRPA